MGKGGTQKLLLRSCCCPCRVRTTRVTGPTRRNAPRLGFLTFFRFPYGPRALSSPLVEISVQGVAVSERRAATVTGEVRDIGDERSHVRQSKAERERARDRFIQFISFYSIWEALSWFPDVKSSPSPSTIGDCMGWCRLLFRPSSSPPALLVGFGCRWAKGKKT